MTGERGPFWLFPPAEPFVAADTASYLVLYKPPRIHSVPLREGEGGTLLHWAASRFPEILRVRGRKPGEGGLLHRLDYETQGLLAAAKTQAAWDSLAAQQEAGEFVKEYEAFSAGPAEIMPGFPPPPSVPAAEAAGTGLIESAFRPWGRGRKAVRPAPADPSGTSGGALYRTDICSRRPVPVPVPPEAADRTVPDEAETAGQPGQPDQSLMSFRLRIARGFRHQIRCHLAWIGAPILNDPLYGGKPLPATGKGFLALRASGLFFRDPESGEGREYRADLFDNPVGYLTVLAVSRLTAAKRAFFSGNCSETEVSEQL